MNRRILNVLVLIGIAMIVMAGCYLVGPDILVYSSEDKQMETLDIDVDIYEEEAGDKSSTVSSRKKKTSLDDNEVLTLKARILPVTVDGVKVQANDIHIKGSTAYIAYNHAGSVSKGAIQVVDISQPGDPEITAELKFPGMDINQVMVSGNNLIFGGQADYHVFGFRSFIGAIKLSNIDSIDAAEIIQSIKGLDSYATTAIEQQAGTIYVGVGAEDGKLYTVDDDLTVLTEKAYPDIRDIGIYKNGIITLAGTTDSANSDGKVEIYRSGILNAPVYETSIEDFGSDYHKASIEMYNQQYAFLGLSEAGFQVLDIKDNEGDSEAVFTLENPVVSYTEKTNTNSVTTDAKYIFCANGEYGFRVLRVLNMTKKNTEFAEIIGYVPFDGLEEDGQPYSANYITYKANHLFVASGMGGVNIYYLHN